MGIKINSSVFLFLSILFCGAYTNAAAQSTTIARLSSVRPLSYRAVEVNFYLNGGYVHLWGSNPVTNHPKKYEIQRSESSSGPWESVHIAKVSHHSEAAYYYRPYQFVDESLAPGKQYYYRIYTSGSYSGSFSNIGTTSTFLGDSPAHSPKLAAEGLGPFQNLLRWNYPASHENLAGFIVQRKTQENEYYQTIHFGRDPNLRSFLDSRPHSSPNTYYRVLAYQGTESDPNSYFFIQSSNEVILGTAPTQNRFYLSVSEVPATQGVDTPFMGTSDRDSILNVHARFSTLARDESGNTIVAQRFSGTLQLCGQNLRAQGALGDILIVKMRPDRSCVWLRVLSASLGAAPMTIKIDSDNNIVLAGSFIGTLALDATTSLEADCHGILSINHSCLSSDIFVIKLSRNGQWIWKRQMGSSQNDSISDIAIDSENYVVLVGLTTTVNQSSSGGFVSENCYPNVYIARLNGKTGSVSWSKKYRYDHSNTLNKCVSTRPNSFRLAVDPNDNIFVSGHVDDYISILGRRLVNENPNGRSNFLLKINRSGSGQWVKLLEAPGNRGNLSIRALEYAALSQEIVLAGSYYRGALDLGLGNLPAPSRPSGGMVLAKFAADGSPRWNIADTAANAVSASGLNAIDQIAIHPTTGHLMLMAIVSGDSYFSNENLIKTELPGVAEDGTPQQVLIWTDANGRKLYHQVHSASLLPELANYASYEAPAFSEMVFMHPTSNHDVDYLSFYSGTESVMTVLERFND